MNSPDLPSMRDPSGAPAEPVEGRSSHPAAIPTGERLAARPTDGSPRIVVVGSVNSDLVVSLPRIPEPGETVVGGRFFRAPGGKGANQAVAAVRAGGAVSLVAAVGQDAFGKEAVAGLEAEGIDTSNLLRVGDHPSGVALIFVDAEGENSIGVAEGANACLGPEEVRNREGVLASSDWMLIQLEIPMQTVEEAVRIAAEHGRRVILNPAPAAALPDEVIGGVSVLTPNIHEAERLTGVVIRDDAALARAADLLLERGAGAVVITLGREGAYLATPDFRQRVRGWSVEAVDTTGAGDVFNGALAVALAEETTLLEAVRFANAAAVISVTCRGAQSSAPARSEILALMDGRSEVASQANPGLPAPANGEA